MRKELSPGYWRKKPVQERSRFTVDVILEAAVQVFEQYGYAAGTTARIAERAGVSVGSLYQYFPNKDAILVALADQHIAECQELATRVFAEVRDQNHTLEQALHDVVAGFVELHVINPQVHRLLSERVVLPPDVQQRLATVLRAITDEVRRLLVQYEAVHEDHCDLAAYIVVQVAEHLTHQLVLHPPHGLTQEACVDEVRHVLLGYIQRSAAKCSM